MSLKEVQETVLQSLQSITESAVFVEQARRDAETAAELLGVAVLGTGDPETAETAALFRGIAAGAATLMQQVVQLPNNDIFPRLERAGVMLPSLTNASQDPTRTNPAVVANPQNPNPTPINEQQALDQLVTFLDGYIANGTNENLKKEAASIRDTLNYVGDYEIDTACSRFADDWSTYLRDNPDAQIVVVGGVSERVERSKSDRIITEKILENVTARDGDFAGRIIGSLDEVQSSPENTRVVIVDDWILSGKQASVTAKRFADAHRDSPYLDRLEVDLVVASPNMLRDGFSPLADTEDDHDADYVFARSIPVVAAYVGRTAALADTADFPTDMHVTGGHSAGDFGFVHPIEEMLEELEELNEDGLKYPTPQLVVQSDYKKPASEYPLTGRLFGRPS